MMASQECFDVGYTMSGILKLYQETMAVVWGKLCQECCDWDKLCQKCYYS